MSLSGLLRREGVEVVVLAIIVSAAFWPAWSLVPGYGGDPSWHLGLSWAAELGFQWGRDVIFTYGPWSYLLEPMAFSQWQVLAASIVHVAGSVATITLAYYACRAQLGLRPAPSMVVSGLAGATLIWAVGPEVAAIVVGSLLVLVRRSWMALAVVSLALGVIGHEKLSDAVLVLGFAVLCAFGALGLRGVVSLTAVTGATWLGLWIAAGQEIGNVPAWIEGAAEISLAHADALALERDGTLWHYPLAVLLSVMTLALAALLGKRFERRRLITLLLATAWFLWLAWNAGFNRHDDGHALLFFEEIVALSVAMMLVATDHRALRLGLVTAAIALLMSASLRGSFIELIDRSASLRSLRDTASVLTSAEYGTAMLDAAADQLADRYSITPELREQLGTEPVLADVGDISAVWAAAGPEWDPIPPLQLLTSFTDGLDQTSAASLVERPRMILRDHPYGAGDGRHPAWDSPRYQRVVYCRYDVALTVPRWQVLRPSGVDRCGTPEGAVAIDANADESVRVPYQPGRMTVLTIRPTISWLQQLQGAILKPYVMSIDYGPGRWRYSFGDVGTRLMLNAPVWSQAFPDLPLAPYKEISIDRPARYTFEFVTIDADRPPLANAPRTGIRDLVIRAAPAVQPEALRLDVLFENDVTVVERTAGCLTVKSGSVDPFVGFGVPAGEGLQVTLADGGTAQVFLEVEDRYTGEHSRRITADDRPFEVFVAKEASSGLPAVQEHAIRVDPPDDGLATICQTTVR